MLIVLSEGLSRGYVVELSSPVLFLHPSFWNTGSSDNWAILGLTSFDGQQRLYMAIEYCQW